MTEVGGHHSEVHPRWWHSKHEGINVGARGQGEVTPVAGSVGQIPLIVLKVGRHLMNAHQFKDVAERFKVGRQGCQVVCGVSDVCHSSHEKARSEPPVVLWDGSQQVAHSFSLFW